MTKKKLPEYKVKDLVRKNKDTFEIISITKEPTARIKNLIFQEHGQEKTVPFSELATYEHYPHSTHIGRPPKTRKTKTITTIQEAAEVANLILSEDKQASEHTFIIGVQDEVEQVSEHGGAPPTPTEPSKGQEQAQESTAPAKVDLSTFELSVKGEGRWQHEMTLGVGDDIQFAKGKDLKPTLLRLLEKFGITGSDAEVETALVLFPDSPGRNLMIDILKGKKKAGD